MAQKVADALRDGPQLQLALQKVDFKACLEAQNAQHMVVLKFLEASLRLRAGLKESATAVFRALGLHASSEYHRVWPSLLALTSLDVAELWQEAKKKTKTQKEDAAETVASGESEVDRGRKDHRISVWTSIEGYTNKQVLSQTSINMHSHKVKCFFW